MDIYIGIDGGGSTTSVLVEDSKGTPLGRAEGGAANIRLSVDKAWESINRVCGEALQRAGISLDDGSFRFHAGMGLAGTELPDACRHFLQFPHRFTTLCLRSDAHAACLGAHEARDGAVIVIGTGVIGYQRESGKNIQVGGWGFPHGDEGGGAWLGLEAVRMTLQWRDGRLRGSPLVEAVYERFHNDLQRLVTWANRADSSRFARIAPLVLDHLESKEPRALRLVKRAAKEIDRLGSAMERRSTSGKTLLPCSLLGGLAPFIEPWLCDKLRLRLVPPKHDAAKGAVLMVRGQLL